MRESSDRRLGLRVLFQEAISMRVNGSQTLGRGYRYMIKPHADDIAVLLVSRVYCRSIRRQLFVRPLPSFMCSRCKFRPERKPAGEEDGP